MINKVIGLFLNIVFVLADYPIEDMVDWLIERNFSNRLKKQNNVEEIKTGMNINFVNMNTNKYMSLDKKTQKVFCSKNLFTFTIETMNDNKIKILILEMKKN